MNHLEGELAYARISEGAAAVRRWFVLQTKSRQEKALASDLQAKGIEHFLPLVRSVRYYGRRKFMVEMPLWSGYLFLNGTVEETYQADRTDRVARMLPVADQEGLERELSELREAIARGAELKAAPVVRKGTRVEVTAGPFRGICGVVSQGHSHDRMVLQVELIGRAAMLEIDGALLRAIE